MEIDADTGEITFIDDPQYDSPGDLDRDGIYHFVVEIEDGNGNTATQAVELEIQDSSSTPFVQTNTFLQHGASICADDVRLTTSANGQSIEDISTGQGNDYVKVEVSNSNDANTVDDDDEGFQAKTIGIELGTGGDTLEIVNVDNTYTLAANSISVDVGTGRDTIVLKMDILSLEVENFDQDDLVNLALYGSHLSSVPDLTLVAPVVKDGSTEETPTVFKSAKALRIAAEVSGQTIQLFSSEKDALDAIGQDEFAFYQNGEDTFMVIERYAQQADPQPPETTVKFEDVVFNDYSNLVFL